MIRSVGTCATLLALWTPLAAADVWDVGGATPDAADIAQALNLASEGDVIRIWPGTYTSFSIDGLSVSLVPAQETGPVTIHGVVTVQNLAAGQAVELNGISASQTGNVSTLRLLQNAGSIRIENCSFRQTEEDAPPSAAGGSIEGCSDVSIVSTSFEGAAANNETYGQAPSGHDGLRIVDSRVALFRCAATGGTGGDGEQCSLAGPGLGGDGGHGIRLIGQGEVFTSLCILLGGWEGYDDWQCSFGTGWAGEGLATDSHASGYTVRMLDSYTATASGIGDGLWIGNGSSLQSLAGQAARLSGPAWQYDDVPLELSVQGQPGDRVGLFFATAYDHDVAQHLGPLLVDVAGSPNYAAWSYLGEVGLRGQLDHSVPMRDLPAFAHVKLHLVAVTVSSTGRQYTHSISPLILDSAW